MIGLGGNDQLAQVGNGEKVVAPIEILDLQQHRPIRECRAHIFRRDSSLQVLELVTDVEIQESIRLKKGKNSQQNKQSINQSINRTNDGKLDRWSINQSISRTINQPNSRAINQSINRLGTVEGNNDANIKHHHKIVPGPNRTGQSWCGSVLVRRPVYSGHPGWLRRPLHGDGFPIPAAEFLLRESPCCADAVRWPATFSTPPNRPAWLKPPRHFNPKIRAEVYSNIQKSEGSESKTNLQRKKIFPNFWKFLFRHDIS